MAIAKDPLKTQNVTKVDFTSAGKNMETAKSGAGSTSLLDKVVDATNGVVDATNSMLDKASNVMNAITDKAMGLFDSIACAKMPSLNLRLPKFKMSAGKGINGLKGLNLKKSGLSCSLDRFKAPMDSLLKVADFIKKNPGILSGDFETRMNALLKSDLLNKMNLFGLGGLVPTCLLNKAVGSINGNDSFMSGSLASKERLKNLMYQSECGAMIANVPFVSKILSQGSGNAIIDILLNGDPTKASTYINMMMQAAGMRDTAIGELVHSIMYAYDYNMYKKLQLTSGIYADLSERDKALFAGNSATNILQGLDKDVKDNNLQFKDPVAELDNLNKMLDLFSPGWNKDENGQPNYSPAEKSDTYKNLAKDYLTKNASNNLDLDGDYTTTLTPAHRIAIPLVFTTREEGNIFSALKD